LEKKSKNSAVFEMVKERHRKSFETALEEKKMDEQLISLCKFVASTKNFFTSSGCAGRIVLLRLDENESKKESAFYRKWHCTVSAKEIIEAIDASTDENLWLKQEPFILHIGTGNIENSRKILEAMREAGVKRGGISVAKEGKFLVELLGSNFMSIPVKVKGKKIVSNDFIENIAEIANKKLERNYENLKRLELALKEKLR